MTNIQQKHMKEIFTTVLNINLSTWPAEVKELPNIVEKLVEGSFQFFKYLNKSIPASPAAFTQKINQRHILSALFGMVEVS